MDTSWERISQSEATEDYPGAIEALEERLRKDPQEREAVVRLGFDYWLAISESDRLSLDVPMERYAARFLELLRTYESLLSGDADFCWVYGLPLSLQHYNFAQDGRDRDELDSLQAWGEKLLQSAASLDSFYAKLQSGQATQKELAARFGGRGCLARYYCEIPGEM